MYYFYAIKSQANNSIYKGISKDPNLRLLQHNSGKVKSTKAFIPYEFIYIEECNNREDARILEKYYKSGTGREIIYQIALEEL
jgi:putative endonuclease